MELATRTQADLTVLIPAFRDTFIEDAVGSCLQQNILPSSIIISDDSPNNLVIKRLQTRKDILYTAKECGVNIQLLEGPKRGVICNLFALNALWNKKTEYYHLLLDDDVIMPEFYQTHLANFTRLNLLGSVSSRCLIDENGEVTGIPALPDMVTKLSGIGVVVPSEFLFKTVFQPALATNWLGETSNALFHKDSADIMFGRAEGSIRSTPGLGDISLFLELGARERLGYTHQYLGGFRQHSNQHTSGKASEILFFGYADWITLARNMLKHERIAEDVSQSIVENHMNVLFSNQEKFSAFPTLKPFFDLLWDLKNPKACADFDQKWQVALSAYFYDLDVLGKNMN
jgi:hypothetical protein